MGRRSGRTSILRERSPLGLRLSLSRYECREAGEGIHILCADGASCFSLFFIYIHFLFLPSSMVTVIVPREEMLVWEAAIGVCRGWFFFSSFFFGRLVVFFFNLCL